MLNLADNEQVVEETVVPANRFGQLLIEARLRNGADLEDLVVASDGEFTVGELADYEAGHRILDERAVRTISGLYEIDCGPIIPQRCELVVDMNTQLLSVAGKALEFGQPTTDAVLERYLALVYVLRNRNHGEPVPLREKDLDILAASLAERTELIEEQLLLAMAPEAVSVGRLTSWFRSRLWVPSAGAVVGVVSMGTLVMTASRDSATASSALTPPEDDLDGENGTFNFPTSIRTTNIESVAQTTPIPEASAAVPIDVDTVDVAAVATPVPVDVASSTEAPTPTANTVPTDQFASPAVDAPIEKPKPAAEASSTSHATVGQQALNMMPFNYPVGSPWLDGRVSRIEQAISEA